MTTKFTWVLGMGVAAALAAAPAAHALTFTGEVEDITYAKETLRKGTDYETEASDDADGTTYYNIERGHALTATPRMSSLAGDNVVLTYTLDDMVFSALIPNDALTGFTKCREAL